MISEPVKARRTPGLADLIRSEIDTLRRGDGWRQAKCMPDVKVRVAVKLSHLEVLFFK